MANVTVVRPYGDRIRARVFACLGEAGLQIRPDDIIPTGTSDQECIERVRGTANRILLVPFHGHRDSEGQRVTGVEFIAKLDRACDGHFGWRVLMPVSKFAKPAVELMFNQTASDGPLRPELRSAILWMFENELDDPGLAQRVQDHVVPTGAPPTATS